MPDHLHLGEVQVRPATYKNSADNSKASRVLVFAIGLAHYLAKRDFMIAFFELERNTRPQQVTFFANPIRAGLSRDVYAYPFSGSFVCELCKFQFPEADGQRPYGRRSSLRPGSGVTVPRSIDVAADYGGDLLDFSVEVGVFGWEDGLDAVGERFVGLVMDFD
jgi:hypothetical protein